MGNKYSQINSEKFPSNYFSLGIKQPDSILILNSTVDLIENIIQCIDSNWTWGLKNEKHFRLGMEIRLNNNPFSNEPGPLEKVLQVNTLIIEILTIITNNGYEIATTGYVLKSFERSTWIFRKCKSELVITSESSKICSIVLEGWNRLIINNIDSVSREHLSRKIASTEKLLVTSMQCKEYQLIIEIDGQPWDSHKSNSVYSPFLILNLIRSMMSCNYGLLCKAHIYGYNDSLFFMKGADKLVSDNDLFILCLNHLDKIRAYDAPSTVINKISSTIKSYWKKGIQTDAVQGSMWMCTLNGSPWCIQDWDKDSSFTSRLLVLEILKELHLENYEIISCIKLYRSQYDKSMFLVKKCPENLSAQSHFFAISPYDVDRLCITHSPDFIVNLYKENLTNYWIKGIKNDNYENGCYEYILEGKPWYINEDNYNINLEALGFFCWVIALAVENCCVLLTTADICSASAYSPIDYIFYKM